MCTLQKAFTADKLINRLCDVLVDANFVTPND